jgi:UDP-glucose:(heptosyl)LPS alpha-1,3-glucosyltransferase
MSRGELNLGFVRRGFSRSGGAEAYLRRLTNALLAAGHQVTLFTSAEWPEEQWPLGRIIRVGGRTPLAFADALEKISPRKHCDLLVSLERIWRCDIFRAGDGVHRAWLERRAQFDPALQKLARRMQGKDDAILQLEQALMGDRGAARVIANSAMVRDEIIRWYGRAAESIEVLHNGVRVSDFGPAPLKHAAARTQLKIGPDETAALFAGSGWSRKGLRFAIAAAERARVRLLVAGRGRQLGYRSAAVQFLGEMDDLRLPLAAVDIFILPTLYDPFANASLEALAAGLPVITTTANGFSEVIEHKVHGTIVEQPADVEALADGLRFWSDSARRRQARTAILERATQFDLSRHVAQMQQLLVEAAGCGVPDAAVAG